MGKQLGLGTSCEECEDAREGRKRLLLSIRHINGVQGQEKGKVISQVRRAAIFKPGTDAK